MYAKFWKRFFDFTLSLIAIIVLSPILLILTVVGAIAMRGNPFFTQLRPGKKGKDGKEKIFRLIKFRTMSNNRDKDGNLLPDAERLNGYGRFLRKTSLDELGELINILCGDMAIVGPRPQLVRDMVFMTDEQRRRHDVRPGLTGWAQINGRDELPIDVKARLDGEYVQKLSFSFDCKCFFGTIASVLKHDGVVEGGTGAMEKEQKQ